MRQYSRYYVHFYLEIDLIDLNRKWPLQNFKKIGSELTEKSLKIMRSWLI